jgi:hypothetical protein
MVPRDEASTLETLTRVVVAGLPLEGREGLRGKLTGSQVFISSTASSRCVRRSLARKGDQRIVRPLLPKNFVNK